MNRLSGGEKSLVPADTVKNSAEGFKPYSGPCKPGHVKKGEEFWNIDCLRARRVGWDDRTGRWGEFVLVRWENYGPDSDTWEPRESLERDVPDMLHEFESATTLELGSIQGPRV